MIWGGWRVSGTADQVRIVIDETSFDFSGIEPGQIGFFLSQFNDALSDFRLMGLKVWKPPLFAYTPCVGEQDLYSYLPDAISPDVMRRFFGLLDKSDEWDAEFPRCSEAEINGGPRQSAWSVCFALTAIISAHGVSCLVFPGSARRGFLDVASDIGARQVLFFAAVNEMLPFWRGLYELENIPEGEFYQLTGWAFPDLIFHPDLSFRRFEGSYLGLRQQIILHLGALNDHFLREYRTLSATGRIGDIEVYFQAYGVDGVSRESVKTHRNVKAMREREVEFKGKPVVCEWHSKLRPNIDRIHFAFGDEFGEKILIGIFVSHLTIK
jgi:hypothetical protein